MPSLHSSPPLTPPGLERCHTVAYTIEFFFISICHFSPRLDNFSPNHLNFSYPALFLSLFFTPPYKHPFSLYELSNHPPPHQASQHPTLPTPQPCLPPHSPIHPILPTLATTPGPILNPCPLGMDATHLALKTPTDMRQRQMHTIFVQFMHVCGFLTCAMSYKI